MTTSTTDAEAIARIIEDEIDRAANHYFTGGFTERASQIKNVASDTATAILSYLALRREAQEPIQITMQDVRLMAGEGTLTAKDTLAAVNAHLRAMHRRTAPPAPALASEKSHIICIGNETIARLRAGESVWFDDVGAGAVAADDLLLSAPAGEVEQ